MAAWVEDPKAKCRILTQRVSLDTIAKPNLWHMRLGHLDTTFFCWMFPLITCHNLMTTDVEKIHDCIQDIYIYIYLLNGAYSLNHLHPFSNFMGIFVGQLIHHQGILILFCINRYIGKSF